LNSGRGDPSGKASFLGKINKGLALITVSTGAYSVRIHIGMKLWLIGFFLMSPKGFISIHCISWLIAACAGGEVVMIM
jgi:hypothetical protein